MVNERAHIKLPESCQNAKTNDVPHATDKQKSQALPDFFFGSGDVTRTHDTPGMNRKQ